MAELRDLKISGTVILPKALLNVRYSRSGGPGGQHVNKVESKVDLRLDLDGCEAIIGVVRTARIRAMVENRLDGDGQLQIVSSEHRQQSMNLEAALNRMEALIRTALAPQKKRRKTKPSRGSQQRRLDHKKQRGEVKKLRRDRDFGD